MPTTFPPLTRATLFERLSELGIETRTVEHPPVRTVAESSTIDLDLPGAHTKNLFLKDEDGKLLLVVAQSSTRADLKLIARLLGTGRLSFGKPELLYQALGVTPGSVNAFAIANDTAQRVCLVIDDTLASHDSVNCHPMENTATTNIAFADLLRFIRLSGHEPKVLAIGERP